MKVNNLLAEGWSDPKFGKLTVPERKSITKAHRILMWWDHNHNYDYGWFARNPNIRDSSKNEKFFGKDADAALKFSGAEQADDLRAYKDSRSNRIALYGIPEQHPDYTWEPKHDGTSKDFIKKIKEELAGKTGDWKIAEVLAGDMSDKHKKDAVTVELSLRLNNEQVQNALKGTKSSNLMANAHTFLIQTTFKLNPVDRMKGDYQIHKQGNLTVWLMQAGQVVSIGYSLGKFNQGDLDSFINALKKATKQPYDKMVAQLYKSGLNHYGRG